MFKKIISKHLIFIPLCSVLLFVFASFIFDNYKMSNCCDNGMCNYDVTMTDMKVQHSMIVTDTSDITDNKSCNVNNCDYGKSFSSIYFTVVQSELKQQKPLCKMSSLHINVSVINSIHTNFIDTSAIYSSVGLATIRLLI
ncbi:MAG: hypothetical protein A2015_05820 [Spirochaetes bacterium GWF1_31_7]|nr:MAG: hypothetical protein A2Y30_00230 [Spirochaetes bacterium GWE1_32_154]OHD47208.1 MAG: hypothetical protein A2Y29_10815 [Spirochaetes bacterium GWE2_31_10]OHD48941.1 MAG: hypothetical protein A2015_05820 [Spirochaetes bacterium GWF1_31_7]OHD74696.1 MAG: hypothetical protein A2355_03390 [Spirochaetes bacterium RIFOXYB1_FULL_32_8]HBD92584.1 hypothetical protein [Spirochaetia bacterium]